LLPGVTITSAGSLGVTSTKGCCPMISTNAIKA
jgi:hypothetical protein